MRGAWFLSCVGVAFAGLGCTELADIDAGVCGNGVVEAGEDCDTNDPSCRAAGDELECRHDCSIDPQSKLRRDCPPGYGCGLADSICRAPTGQFEPRARPPTDATLFVTTADFDGDRREDLIAAEFDRYSIHFFDQEGLVDETTSFRTMTTEPVVGSLTELPGAGTDEAPRASLVIPYGDIGVMRGQTDRTLAPTAYAPFVVKSGEARFLMLDALHHDNTGMVADPTYEYSLMGDEVLEFLTIGDVGEVWSVSPTLELLFSVDLKVSTLYPRIPHADVNQMPGEEFAIAAPKAGHVTVYQPGRWDDVAQRFAWQKSAEKKVVKLPTGRELGGPPIFAQMNPLRFENEQPVPGTDDLWDLVVRATIGPIGNVFVAYGDGNGGFHPSPSEPTELAFSAYSPVELPDLLVHDVGDLNGDSIPDFAGALNPDGTKQGCLLLSSGSGWEVGFITSEVWTQADIVDVNRDGLLDVVAATEKGRKVDLLVGAGWGQFNAFELPTTGTVTEIAVGDVDGDLLEDIVLSEQPLSKTEGQGDTLSVMFGRSYGAPEAPVTLGDLGAIQGIVLGKVASPRDYSLDAIADIGVVSQALGSDEMSAALFFGRTDRQLQSRFSLFTQSGGGESVFHAASRVVVGQFDGAPHPDLAVISTMQEITSGVPGSVSGWNFWPVPSSGEAQLSSSGVSPSADIDFFEILCGSLVAAVDLDPPGSDGIDELVVLGTDFNSLKGRLRIARASTSPGLHFELDAPVELPELYASPVLATQGCVGSQMGAKGEGGGEDSSEGATSPLGQVSAIDVDGDGLRDLVTLGYVMVAENDGRPRIVLWMNRGTGKLDLAERVVIDPATAPGAGTDFVMLSFALLNADLDPQYEVVMTSTSGVYLAELDLASGSLGELVPRESVHNDARVVTGDVNGDGVADLITAGQEGVFVNVGVPVLQ